MENQEEKPKKLPESVGKKYQVLDGHGVGEYHFGRHRVNLDTISLETADRLVGEGFPYLVEITEPKKVVAAVPAPAKPTA